MSAGAALIDPLQLVDAELRPALDAALNAMPAAFGELTPGLLHEIRTRSAAWAPRLADTPVVVERAVPGANGAPDVRVFVINADARTLRPAVVHMHGGGFFTGVAAHVVPGLQAQAAALDCVIVTVDYRLAPETPFPGALDDNYAALAWVHDHADELGIDRSRIAVQGESAGAGHAAMLAIHARNRGQVPICLQLLDQPMLDDRTGSSREPAAHIGTFLWVRQLNVWGWQALLGRAPGGSTAPAGAVPSREADLSGLPPTWIAIGALDLFVDESIDYARRLLSAGVPTELLVVPGAFHGFPAVAPQAAVTLRYRSAMLDALARAFGRPPASRTTFAH